MTITMAASARKCERKVFLWARLTTSRHDDTHKSRHTTDSVDLPLRSIADAGRLSSVARALVALSKGCREFFEISSVAR